MRGQKLFCDIRVFNPLAKCQRTNQLAKIHKKHMKEKKVKYATRVIEVEHGSFTPLVFSCFGGMSRECAAFYKRLAEKIGEKRNISTSEATCYLRTKISFSLVRSLVLCICGSRSIRDNQQIPIAETDISLANTEGHLRQSQDLSLHKFVRFFTQMALSGILNMSICMVVQYFLCSF